MNEMKNKYSCVVGRAIVVSDEVCELFCLVGGGGEVGLA